MTEIVLADVVAVVAIHCTRQWRQGVDIRLRPGDPDLPVHLAAMDLQPFPLRPCLNLGEQPPVSKRLDVVPLRDLEVEVVEPFSLDCCHQFLD